MLEHKGFRKLAFTFGSTEVGRTVGLAAAERIIPSTLELGGKSANIFLMTAILTKPLTEHNLAYCLTRGRFAVQAAGYLFRIHSTISL